MHKELRLINEALYIKLEKVYASLLDYQEDVYIHMQVFLEQLFKQSLLEVNPTQKKHLTLGQMLHNNQLRKKLFDAYTNFNLEKTKRIVFWGNQTKHTLEEKLSEHVIEDIVYVSLCVSDYLLKQQIRINPLTVEDLKKSVQETAEPAYIQESFQQKTEKSITQISKEITETNTAITKVKEQLGGVVETMSPETLTLEIKKTNESLIKTENTLETLEEKRVILINRAKEENLTDETNQAILKERTQVQNALQKHELEYEDLTYKLTNLMSLQNQDIEDINRNKLKSRLEALEERLEELTQNKVKFQELYDRVSSRNDYFARAYKLKVVNEIKDSMNFSSSYLQNQSYRVTNLSFEQVSTHPQRSYYAVLYNALTRGAVVAPSRFLNRLNLNDDDLSKIYAIEVVILCLIRTNKLKDNSWSISIDDDAKWHLKIAFRNLKRKLKQLSKLTDEKPRLPKLIISDANTLKLSFELGSSDANTHQIFIRHHNSYLSENKLWIESFIPYRLNSLNTIQQSILEEFLYEWFKHKNFRKGQYKILANYLNGASTIGILPTGSGKSMIFYMAAMLQPKQTIVIAPLTTLIDDQVGKLKNVYGFGRVDGIISSQKANEKTDIISKFKKQSLMMVFVSPERLQNMRFRYALHQMGQRKQLGHIVLDEVHCLSDWGHDFRISYLMLAKTINDYIEKPRFLGLTATASVNVIQDLMIELKITNMKNVVFSREFKRDNLIFKLHLFDSPEAMEEKLSKAITNRLNDNSLYNVLPKKDNPNTGIIFCRTKKNSRTSVELVHHRLYEDIKNRTPLSQKPFIGKFTGTVKSDFGPFMNNEITLLVATKAFGMGVDKPNVRFTIHYGIPSSREAFYQEAGRAGRDTKEAHCHLFTYLPSLEEKPLIDELLSLKTPVKKLKDLSRKLPRDSYISTNSFFLTKDLSSPEEEAEVLEKYYQEIIAGKRSYRTEQNEQYTIEKYLYQLYKLGLINNWSVDYISLNGFASVLNLEVREDKLKDIEHIKKQAHNYLSAYHAQKQYLEKIEEVKTLDEIKQIFVIVRSWYHDTFIRNQREQLANMVEFVEKHHETLESHAIQEELDNYFDLSTLYDNETSLLSIDLNEETYQSLVDRVFEVEEKDLNLVQANTERVLESFTNEKIDLYMSLIHLRQGTFLRSRNGLERFILVEERLKVDERTELIGAIIRHYSKLNQQQRLDLLSHYEKEKETFDQISSYIHDCSVINGYVAQKLNNRLLRLWEDYAYDDDGRTRNKS